MKDIYQAICLLSIESLGMKLCRSVLITCVTSRVDMRLIRLCIGIHYRQLRAIEWDKYIHCYDGTKTICYDGCNFPIKMEQSK